MDELLLVRRTCVPSRRGLMTGRHPVLMGNAKLVDARDKLMAAMLKRHGYRTAILGKWHLAGYPKDFTASPMHPLECGFDYHYGTPGSNDVPAPQGRVVTVDWDMPTVWHDPQIRCRNTAIHLHGNGNGEELTMLRQDKTKTLHRVFPMFRDF